MSAKKLHVDFLHAFAIAFFASPAADVEAEMTGRQIVCPSVNCVRKRIADVIKRFDVGDGIGATGPADWRLIDHHDLMDWTVADQARIRQRLRKRFVFAGTHSPDQRVEQQGAFAAATDAGNHAETTQGKIDVDVFQVMASGTGQFHHGFRFAALVAAAGDARTLG